MNSTTNELANRQTLRQLVESWEQSKREIHEAHAILKRVEERLRRDFSADPSSTRLSIVAPHALDKLYRPDDLIKYLERDLWAELIKRMEIRPLLSIERARQLDDNINNGKMPPISEQSLAETLGAALANRSTFIEEAVKEVFEMLRPRNNKYKTNTQLDIGKKVILTWAIESRWGHGYTARFGTSDRLRALDNVFHLLDGKGMVKTYYGPLIEAIEKSGTAGVGETEYFKFKCYQNLNLHLEFKRMDLVQKLNAAAGGNRLYPNREGV